MFRKQAVEEMASNIAYDYVGQPKDAIKSVNRQRWGHDYKDWVRLTPNDKRRIKKSILAKMT